MVDHSVEYALDALRDGEIVIYPTETAYAVGANALSKEAIRKVYEAKQRDRSKKIGVICSSIEQAKKYSRMTRLEEVVAEEFMPGPLTLVVEKTEDVPDLLNKEFAFRISPTSFARTLASESPITATSANISGQETSYSVDDIDEELLEKVEAIVDRGELEGLEPSTVAEIKDGEVFIHREGPVSSEEIEAVIDDIDVHN